MDFLSVFFFFLFVLILYKWLFTKSTQTKNLPPSPPKLPVLGHLHKLGTFPHRSLQTLSERYGDIMLIYLGYKPTMIVSSATAAKEILKSKDSIFSNKPKSIINDKLMYNSRDVATAPYGEYWRQMRSVMVLQLLSNRRVRSFRSIREEETALMIENINKAASPVVNLSELFVNLSNDVICRVAFGRKYSGEQNATTNFEELLHEFNELLGVFDVGGFIPWLAWVNRFNGLYKRLDKVSKRFDVLLERILNEHLDKLEKEGSSSNNDQPEICKDFVDNLLEAQKDNAAGFSIERDSIKAMILDAFAAGTHTTSTVMDWTMTELLRHPRIMQKVQEEVREITKDKQYITEDNLEKMKYLNAVIKETLRLHPPVPLLVPRESTQEVKIRGYDIAAGTLVFISAWAIHRDPAIWEEPEEFRPERFLDSAVDFKGQDFELIPFGAGRRMCPGLLFGMATNELVLANLVHKFNWALPAGVKGETMDMSEVTGLTMRRKAPLLAVATPCLHH